MKIFSFFTFLFIGNLVFSQVELDDSSPAKKDFGRMNMLLRMYSSYPEKGKKIKEETYIQLKDSYQNCKIKEPTKDWEYYNKDVELILNHYEASLVADNFGSITFNENDQNSVQFTYTLPKSLGDIASEKGVSDRWPKIFYLNAYMLDANETQVPIRLVALPNTQEDNTIKLVIIPSEEQMASEWYEDLDWVYNDEGQLISTVDKSIFLENLDVIQDAHKKVQLKLFVDHKLGDGKSAFKAQCDFSINENLNLISKKEAIEMSIINSSKWPERKSNNVKKETKLARLIEVQKSVEVIEVIGVTPDNAPVKYYNNRDELVKKKWYYAVVFIEDKTCVLKYYYHTEIFTGLEWMDDGFHESKGDSKKVNCNN